MDLSCCKCTTGILSCSVWLTVTPGLQGRVTTTALAVQDAVKEAVDGFWGMSTSGCSKFCFSGHKYRKSGATVEVYLLQVT